jgi:fatty-acyl-CoA synthase
VNLWQLLLDAARAHGDRTAFVVDGTTYAEATVLAERLARSLGALGVAKGDRVACLQHNTADHWLSYFAVAGIDAILVSLNTRLAAEEIAGILAHSGSKVLLHDAELGALAEQAAVGTDVQTIDVAALLDATALQADRPLGTAAADDVVHLYYTSGTTGDPKGVTLSHLNVATHAHWAVDELSLTAADRWAHIAPMFHLADAWATFAVTIAGGGHSFLPRFGPDTALDLLVDEATTITNLVPTMLGRMVAEPDASTRDYSLRTMLSGGAPIAKAVVERILRTFSCDYVQTYGMTETSPYLTLSLLTEDLRSLPDDEQLSLKCRTGRPFAGVGLRVVGDDGEDVPRDDVTVGEVRVNGPTVTTGYWNNPEATRQVFDERGWLCTGDLATVDRNGWIMIVDRMKDVIKTGGETVFSTEVEQVLHRHADVLECAVYGTPDPDWGEIVTAAVVLRREAAQDAAGLISFCRERIAHFKSPRRVLFLTDLPKTGSGKIQKSVLRERR